MMTPSQYQQVIKDCAHLPSAHPCNYEFGMDCLGINGVFSLVAPSDLPQFTLGPNVSSDWYSSWVICRIQRIWYQWRVRYSPVDCGILVVITLAADSWMPSPFAHSGSALVRPSWWYSILLWIYSPQILLSPSTRWTVGHISNPHHDSVVSLMVFIGVWACPSNQCCGSQQISSQRCWSTAKNHALSVDESNFAKTAGSYIRALSKWRNLLAGNPFSYSLSLVRGVFSKSCWLLDAILLLWNRPYSM